MSSSFNLIFLTMKANILFKSLLFAAATFAATQANAQVKVGNNPTVITPSAVFDVESTNKGVIMPRIALTSITDQTTISAPAAGLLVYNTGTAGLTYKGYVFWDGTQWKKLDGSAISSSTANTGDAVVTYSTTLGPLTYTTEDLVTSQAGVTPNSGYHRTITSPDGKYSVRVKIESGYAFSLADLNIKSNSGNPSIIWNTSTEWINGILHNGNNTTTFAAAGVWYGNGGGDGTSLSDSDLNSAWGDPDVYFGSAPEHRRYTWTSTDQNDKTIYTLTFMLAATNGGGIVANPSNCPGGTCVTTKAYLRIEQVTAP